MTKADTQRRMQQLLHEAATDEWFGAQDPRFDFFMSLLECHPEAHIKIGDGIVGFCVKLNLPYGNRGPWLMREDGSETDWSYMKCLRAPSDWTLFCRGLRAAVFDQILDFRLVNCVIPGHHVDHEDPTFNELARMFLDNYVFEDSDQIKYEARGDGCTGPIRFIPAPWVCAWQAFHLENANLRGLTPSENLRRKRRS